MVRLFICLVSSVLLVACQPVNSTFKEAEQISKTVSDQYIPDSREDLFQIQFRTKGKSLLVFGETTNSEAQKALEQIDSRNYEAELNARGINKILKLGIVFFGKMVLVKAG